MNPWCILNGMKAGWLRDLKYGIRVLSKARASTLAVILILALTIGATTAVFTFLDRLLFQPLPLPNPSQLVLLTPWEHVVGGDQIEKSSTFSYENYRYLRDREQSLSGLAGEAVLVARERRLHQKLDHPAEATAVSGNFFDVLGARPWLGRLLIPRDDTRGGVSHVAVASYRFWRRRFNRAPDALGRTVYLNNAPFTIVGVLPAGFYGIHKGYDPDLYVPLGSLPDLFSFDPLVEGSLLRVFGRLRTGVSAIHAQSNLQVLWVEYLTARVASVSKESPQRAEDLRKEFAGDRIELESGAAGYAGTQGAKRQSLILLAAIVALLFLIGCANVACLLLARGVARRREISIRLSLGASKACILRQSLIESCLLSLAGGAAGLAVAFWADRLLLIAFEWTNRPIDLSPDWRVLSFGLAISLATGILVGLVPALQLLGGASIALNQESAPPRLLSGPALVVLEMALSLVLVAGAALFTRSFQNMRSVPVGFSPEHISVLRLASPSDPDEESAVPVQENMRLADSLRRTSGIESASLSDTVMFNDSYLATTVAVPGFTPRRGLGPHLLRVDQGYFDTLRIRLLAGRAFEARDDERAPKVAVLSVAAARRLFPNQNPVGRNILLGRAARHPKPGDETQVIGVVNDTKFESVIDPAPAVIYVPWSQGLQNGGSMRQAVLQIRSSMTPQTLAAMLGSQIRAGHLPMTIESVSTLEEEIATSLRSDRLRMQASGLFSATALLLIVAGISGLMAYSVVRRTREIGIRMAVGSTPSGILRLILKESLGLTLIGVLVGIPGAIAVMRALAGMVFGLAPVDSTSLAIAASVLAITGIAASIAPAMRAAHLDPMSALRTD